MLVTLLVGEPVDTGALLRSALGDRDLKSELRAVLGEHELALITTDTATTGPFDRVVEVDPRHSRRQRALSALGGESVTRFLRATPPGRLLLSLSPWAKSRVFHRAVAADPQAVEIVARSDVLIAVDQTATFVAWKSRRYNPAQRALWGVDQALRLLRLPS